MDRKLEDLIAFHAEGAAESLARAIRQDHANESAREVVEAMVPAPRRHED